MNFIKLLFFTAILVLTGCKLPQPSELKTPLKTKDNIETVTFAVDLKSTIIEISKKPEITWNMILPEWNPKIFALVHTGDSDEIIKNLSDKSTTKVLRKLSQHADSMTTASIFLRSKTTPLISSTQHSDLYDCCSIANGFSINATPTLIDQAGAITLNMDITLNLNGRFINWNQKTKTYTGQSILIAHAINQNTLQIAIITPSVPIKDN
ncbi:hypothetical protein [Pectobacterium atrosepticum]|uniref:hypothetical protein n=1 Tax=Pectobacterium atrosepticum TaxID=29471 RepID=UPI003019D56B